jgi:hypothetical protein
MTRTLKGVYVTEVIRDIDMEINRRIGRGDISDHNKATLTYLAGIQQYLRGKSEVSLDEIGTNVLKPHELPDLHIMGKAELLKGGGLPEKIAELAQSAPIEPDNPARSSGCMSAMAALHKVFDQCLCISGDKMELWRDKWIAGNRNSRGEPSFENRERYAEWVLEEATTLKALKSQHNPVSQRIQLYEDLTRAAKKGLQECLIQGPNPPEGEALLEVEIRREVMETAKRLGLESPDLRGF